MSNLSQFVPASVKDLWHQWKSLMTRGEEAKEGVEGGPKREISSDDKWGVKEAQENHKEEASKLFFSFNQTITASGNGTVHDQHAHHYSFVIGLATQLALAYAVHKSFIFIRVPLTAAVTPRVVKTLRSWGWDIGKKVSKA